jgi:hypothetical protein
MDKPLHSWLVASAPETPALDLHALAMERVSRARQKSSWLATVDAALRGSWLYRPGLSQAVAWAAAFVFVAGVGASAIAILGRPTVDLPGQSPLIPAATPTAAPSPLPTSTPAATPAPTPTPSPTPSLEPIVAHVAEDFFAPFEYLLPDSVHVDQGNHAAWKYALTSRGNTAGDQLVFVRIDGGSADDCPRRGLASSVELPRGVDAILETLETEGGMTFEKTDVGLMRSGYSAYELTTTAECLDHIHVHGATVNMTGDHNRTWILDVPGGTLLIQASAVTSRNADEWLTAAAQIVDSMVFLSDLRPEASPSTINRDDFDDYLAGYGQLFTPEEPPLTAADWRPRIEPLARSLGNPERATYGVVSCVNSDLNCQNRGLVRPGETLAIWLIEFPPVTGCPVWWTFDATAAVLINGSSPPC